MHRNFSTVIALVALGYVALQMSGVFSGSDAPRQTWTAPDSYVDATGREVALSDYFGGYLWVDYAAEWCSYCEPQARTLKGLEKRYGDKITFLTVVTGTGKVMEPPSAQTAMDWARRFGLDTDKVLAYFSTNKLPYHILYSPSGAILFQASGLLDANKITHVLNTHASLVD